MKTKIFLSIILVLSPALCALSQIPQGFNYQAIARDASGNPITNTAMQVRITIQSEQTGGTIFWQELHSSVTTNDFGMLTLVVGQGTKEGGTAATFADIDWSVTPKYIKTEIDYGGWKEMGVSQLWAVPYSMAAEELTGSVKKLTVAGETTSMEEPLFEVKNKNGQTVFAVYNEGVRAYVGDGDAKGVKGGFAIGSFDTSKGERDLFVVSTDSIRAYIYDDPLNKGVKGGFAIGGFDNSKKLTNDYLLVSPDSVRIYIDKETTKGIKKGGFAIGGFDDSKAGKSTFFDVSPDTNDIILSENRILWYPLKNAFLTGKVKIEHPDSVGLNSFASGNESKAKGQYSQALGYQAIARGDYSTAIGKNAVAHKINSFAFGENAHAKNAESYAFGRGAIAEGFRSFAFGSAGVDSAGQVTGVAYAKGDYSFAIGQGSQALGKGAFAMGLADTAKGDYSLAMGYKTRANGLYSTAFGRYTTASGEYSTAFGYYTTASGYSSTAFGLETTASNTISTAFGQYTTASGTYSTAFGLETTASGFSSTAFGWGTIASRDLLTAFGYYTTASGSRSTAFGHYTTASGSYSTAFGYYTKANTYAMLAFGRFNDTTKNHGTSSYYNWYDDDPIFVIGNGTADINRKNALTILKNGNTGIGTSTPAYKLDVNGEIVSRSANAFKLRNTSYSILLRNDNTDFWLLLTDKDDPGGTWNSLRPFRIELSTGNVFFGNGALTVFHGGNTGIGANPSSSYKLYVNGSAYATGSWTSSDIKWKKNIQPLTGVLNDVSRLQLVSYDWRTEEFPDLGFDNDRHIGLIAQDVEKVFPLLVRTNEDGSKAIAYDKLSAVLVEAIKEQQQQIEAEKAKNKELENELVTLKERLSALEAMMGKE